MEPTEVTITHNLYRNIVKEEVNYKLFMGDNNPFEIYYTTGKANAKLIIDGFKKRSESEPEQTIDYGCGDGRIARFMAAECKRLLCLDISEPIVESASEKFKEFGISNIKLSLDTDFKRYNYADFIYCMQVLQHCTYEEQINTAKNIRSLLKKGALACIHFPMIEDKQYGNSDTCMFFTREQVEFFGKMFFDYEIEIVEFNKDWFDYFLWVKKESK